jgi:hypothetical protein
MVRMLRARRMKRMVGGVVKSMMRARISIGVRGRNRVAEGIVISMKAQDDTMGWDGMLRGKIEKDNGCSNGDDERVAQSFGKGRTGCLDLGGMGYRLSDPH